MSEETPETAPATVASEAASAPKAKGKGRPKKEKAPIEEKPKKVKTEKPKKTTTGPAAHPPVSEMVIVAVTSLDEKGGSSSVNIKKYLSSEYKVDTEKLSTYIRKALRNAVESGKLLQTKGKNGSYKLPYYVKSKSEKKAKKIKEEKVKKSPAKKTSQGRGKPKKDVSTKVKAAKPKAETGAGRGRPKKNPAELKPKASPSGKGRGRPKKASE
jgi:histone H1/5